MIARINKIYRSFRTSDWWEYKISPILAIAYATSITLDSSVNNNILWILILIVSITIGAIFVSTINDISDIEDDIASGKPNRMTNINIKYRWIIPTTCILLGLICLAIFSPDIISMILYTLPWLAYSLYSFKPFRLKERGFLGVLADALGAHVFISLFIVSSLSYYTESQIDWTWFFLIGAWTLIVGIKGILWHQYFDRENDLISQTRTFATTIDPSKIQQYEMILICSELCVLALILIKLNILIVNMFFGIYLIISFLRYTALNHQVTIILFSKKYKSQILLFDFYVAILPISLLIYYSTIEPKTMFLLVLHLVLFPNRILEILRDLKAIIFSVRGEKI